uniref:ATP synthase subunit a n=1 Tax=Heterodoxus macropus TaxID=145266 RepID=Q9B8F9_9NEOP|nr:ATP synthase 6 [Heterodoxus macropus]
MSLLSIFDPCSSILNIFNFNWMVMSLCLLIPLNSFWKVPSILLTFFDYMKNLMKSMFTNKVNFQISSIFFLILVFNILGIFCFTFSVTSHLVINLSLGFSIWVGTLLYSSIYKLSDFLAHLTPMGCPMVLVPFMVVIEFISMMIRPITLSLRLMANMLAGHMILSLISTGVSLMLSLFIPSGMLLLLGFYLFEIGVAIIQAYVFSILLSLYWEEVLEE